MKIVNKDLIKAMVVILCNEEEEVSNQICVRVAYFVIKYK